MNTIWLKRGLKLVGAVAVAVSLSGCIVAPYPGPHYGYYRPHYYGYY